MENSHERSVKPKPSNHPAKEDRPAVDELRVELVVVSGIGKWLAFVRGLLGSLLLDQVARWPPYRTQVIHRKSGKSVVELGGLKDTSETAALMQSDLERMSLREFCSAWGIPPDVPARGPDAGSST